MDQNTYSLLEAYKISCMDDSAHDKEQVYRVLYNAMRIARKEENVDYDVLIGACLLHDIGRKEQFENPESFGANLFSFTEWIGVKWRRRHGTFLFSGI